MLDDLFDYCFPILDKIGHKLDSIEDEMFEGHAEDVVRDISNVKQEIISYRKVIKPGRSTLRALERRIDKFLPEELDLYFDDIVDSAERIWDQLDNYKEVVDGLESTNESVISHRQNDVLRVLTIFSVIVLPLTLISGIFGMNVDFPGFGTHAAFWVIIALMVAVMVGHGRLLPPQALALAVSACSGRAVSIAGEPMLAGSRSLVATRPRRSSSLAESFDPPRFRPRRSSCCPARSTANAKSSSPPTSSTGSNVSARVVCENVGDQPTTNQIRVTVASFA